jgi:hypothetical protein
LLMVRGNRARDGFTGRDFGAFASAMALSNALMMALGNNFRITTLSDFSFSFLGTESSLGAN